MKLRAVFIDEVIHVDDPIACKLWQKTLWAKERGYRQHYKTSVMPVSADDFFATHFIVAEEKSNGELEPVAMLKSVKKSQCERFGIEFGATALLKGTGLQNVIDIQKVIKAPTEISYESSWTVNPDYPKSKELSEQLRGFMTMYACIALHEKGIPRWLTAGVTQFKIDQYFEWLGGKQILPTFTLPIIDNQSVRMMYIENTAQPPQEAMNIAQALRSEWNNRIEFSPTTNGVMTHGFRAA